MHKYLVHALLKGIYGSAQDQLLIVLRNAFREEIKSETGAVSYQRRYQSFSFKEVLKISLPQQKSLAVTADDVERFLQARKGSTSFWVLSLLYPQLRYNEVWFHQDHIHPYAGFSEAKFREMGIPAGQWQEWLECRDCVPNLQLMEGKKNESKNATSFKTWFGQLDENKREAFARDNYLPENSGLEFENFKLFFNQRKELLRRELSRVLALTSQPTPDGSMEWAGRDDEIEVPETPLADGIIE
jgi:hypothetical protein